MIPYFLNDFDKLNPCRCEDERSNVHAPSDDATSMDGWSSDEDEDEDADEDEDEGCSSDADLGASDIDFYATSFDGDDDVDLDQRPTKCRRGAASGSNTSGTESDESSR